jgi:hypothetical protein
MNLEEDLRATINRHSAENGSDTPDFILASYLLGCLDCFDAAVLARSNWYGRHDSIKFDAERDGEQP